MAAAGACEGAAVMGVAVAGTCWAGARTGWAVARVAAAAGIGSVMRWVGGSTAGDAADAGKGAA